jgi:hypothetical protein
MENLDPSKPLLALNSGRLEGPSEPARTAPHRGGSFSDKFE